MRAVTPDRGAAPYQGGKRHLARRLVARIDAIPHQTYVEVFVGMGGVFFRRHRAPKVEVINDLNGEVANFFRVLQRHYLPFVEMMRWQLTVRAEFERLAATDPATLTDLERAARFYYMQHVAFGGKASGASFGVDRRSPGRFDVTRLAPRLEDIHGRLAGVVVECLPYADLIARYDAPEALFYLDPPYLGGEGDYGKGLFERADFARLAAILADIAGRFLLSINDTPETRATFAEFAIEPVVAAAYTIAKGAALRRARELIVSDGRPAPAGPEPELL